MERAPFEKRDAAIVGFGLIGVLLIASCVANYANVMRLAANNRQVAHTDDVILELGRLKSSLQEAELSQRGYLLLQDAVYLDRFRQSEQSIQQNLQEIQDLTSDNPGQQSRLDSLRQQVARRVSEMQEAIGLAESGDVAAAIEDVRSARSGDSSTAAILESIAEMQQIEHDLLRERAGQSDRSFAVTIWSTLLLTAAGIVLIAIAFNFIRRAAKERARHAAMVAEREERLRVTLSSIGDGVITTDTNGKILSINPVAEKLTGWTQAEAAGQPLTSVFRIVNETSRQPAENPALRALKDGVIVGLANHTVLIRKDDSELPIDDSAAPIRDRAGVVRGSVLVFRDISDRRQSEKEEIERHRLTRLRAEVGTALAASGQLQTALQQCCEAVVDQMQVALARIWTLNESEATLELQASAGIDTQRDGDYARVPVGQFLVGRIAASRQPQLSNNVEHDPNVSEQEWSRQAGMTAFAGLPLIVESRIVGVMALFAKEALSPAVLDDLITLAEAIAQYVDRRRAEQALQENAELLQVTLKSIGDGMVTTDQEGRVTFLNAVAEELTGWTQADAVGLPLTNIFQIINEQTRQPVDNPALRALNEGIHVGLANHTVLISRTGEERFIDDCASPIRDAHGNIRGAVLIFRDITERRLLERQNAERTESARFLASIVENSEDPIISKSLDGIVQTWNNAAQRQFGYTAEEAIGHHISFLFPPDRLSEEDLLISRLRAGERIKNFDTIRVRKDGSQVNLSLTISPIRDESGKIVGASKIARDITERIQAAAALQESETRKAAMLNLALDGIITIDAQGNILEFNPAAEEMFGYDRDQVVGQEMASFIIPERLREEHRAGITRYLQTGEGPILNQRLELHAIRADGTEFPIELAITRINDEGPPQFTGFIRDITERRQAEDALRRSSRRLRFIMDSLPQKIYTALPTGEIDYFNPVWMEFSGLPSESIRDWGWMQFVHPDDVGENAQAWQDAVSTGQPFQFQHRFRRRDGQYRWHLTRAIPMRDDDGRISMWIGSSTDIDDMKQAEEATRRRSEQLRQLAQMAAQINVAQNIPSVLGVITAEARMLLHAHCSVTSFAPEQNWDEAEQSVATSEEYAQSHADVPRPDGRGIYAMVCRSNQPVRMTQSELESNPDWKKFWDDAPGHLPSNGWLAAPLMGRDGKNIGVVQLSDKQSGEFTEDDEMVLVQMAQMASVAIENARLYEELRQIAADLSEADRRKTEFLATLGHELRNPLAPIRTGLEAIKLVSDDPDMREEIRSTMERQTQQMVRLIDDLLDVSRITKGKLELRTCRVSLADVVQSAVEATGPFIDEAGHELHISLPNEPIELTADPNRLAQVFSNLLNNSTKYTPEGGQIWLSAERQGSDVVVSVKDNGVGIPLELQKGIFEMFTQIDRPLEQGYKGLGIGLTLVKRLVEMHGGSVEVCSAGTDQGSEFRVRLPIMLTKADVQRGPTPTVSSTLTRLRILVVDDNKAAADMLGMVVKMLGNEVRTAYDGAQGVEVAEEYRPDIVLMDLGMPRMTGYEAARHIREHDWGREMVLVALTGWGQEEDKQRTKAAGFDHHLVKPAEPGDLQRLFAELDVRTS